MQNIALINQLIAKIAKIDLELKDNILLTQDNEAWAYFNIEALSISDNDEAGISKRQTQLSLLFDRLADFEDFELRL